VCVSGDGSSPGRLSPGARSPVKHPVSSSRVWHELMRMLTATEFLNLAHQHGRARGGTRGQEPRGKAHPVKRSTRINGERPASHGGHQGGANF
jgi:hypothetical protein